MAVLIGTLVAGTGAGVAVATALAVHAQRHWVRRGPAAEAVDA